MNKGRTLVSCTQVEQYWKKVGIAICKNWIVHTIYTCMKNRLGKWYI